MREVYALRRRSDDFWGFLIYGEWNWTDQVHQATLSPDGTWDAPWPADEPFTLASLCLVDSQQVQEMVWEFRSVLRLLGALGEGDLPEAAPIGGLQGDIEALLKRWLP